MVYFAEFQKKRVFGLNSQTLMLPGFKYKRTPVIREFCSDYRCSSQPAPVLIRRHMALREEGAVEGAGVFVAA